MMYRFSGTIDDVKRLCEFIEHANTNGLEIQALYNGKWKEKTGYSFNGMAKYRYKPQKKFVPFETDKEFTAELIKNQTNGNFGLIEHKTNKRDFRWVTYSSNEYVITRNSVGVPYGCSLNYLFEYFVFSNGKPIGKEVGVD